MRLLSLSLSRSLCVFSFSFALSLRNNLLRNPRPSRAFLRHSPHVFERERSVRRSQGHDGRRRGEQSREVGEDNRRRRRRRSIVACRRRRRRRRRRRSSSCCPGIPSRVSGPSLHGCALCDEPLRYRVLLFLHCGVEKRRTSRFFSSSSF